MSPSSCSHIHKLLRGSGASWEHPDLNHLQLCFPPLLLGWLTWKRGGGPPGVRGGGLHWDTRVLALFLALLSTCCVTPRKQFLYFGPHFSHLWNGKLNQVLTFGRPDQDQVSSLSPFCGDHCFCRLILSGAPLSLTSVVSADSSVKARPLRKVTDVEFGGVTLPHPSC